MQKIAKFRNRLHGKQKAAKRIRQISLFESAGWRCERCGKPNQLTRDHIVPKSMGGSNALINKQCLCRKCNEKKENRIEVYTNRRDARLYAKMFGWQHNLDIQSS